MLKTRVSLSSKTLNYIQRYQIIHKKVISTKKKKRGNDEVILTSTKPTTEMWQL